MKINVFEYTKINSMEQKSVSFICRYWAYAINLHIECVRVKNWMLIFSDSGNRILSVKKKEIFRLSQKMAYFRN